MLRPSVNLTDTNKTLTLPLVHVIVLTWNHWEVTAPCLQSLLQVTYPTYQVIVVDNGSTDDTVKHTREQFPSVTVIENGRNLGFAAGCNVGMRHAQQQGAEYVLLLNNDTVVPPNLLDVLVEQAQSLPDAGILSPMLSHLDNPEQLWFTGSRRHWLTLESVDFGPLGARRHLQHDKRHTVDYIFGTDMFIPTAVLNQVGLLDDAFFMYYEDMDFCLRVQAAGYQLYYIPDVSVQHRVSASTESFSAVRYYHKARASVIFFRKHTGFLRRLFIIPYRIASMVRTVMRLAGQKQWPVIRAYLQGLRDGLSLKVKS